MHHNGETHKMNSYVQDYILPHCDGLIQIPLWFRKYPGMHWHLWFGVHLLVQEYSSRTPQILGGQGRQSGIYSLSGHSEITVYY